MKNNKLEDLFPIPNETWEERMPRYHNWHNERIGDVEYHVCKECEKVEMSITYEVSRDYSNFDQTTRVVLRKANKGFGCSQT